MTFLAAALLMQDPAWPVPGVYTTPDTKDVGQLTGLKILEGLKIRGWIDIYYAFNANTPDRGTVDANQGVSVVKGRDVSIEGRTFDVHHNSFSVSLAEVELELVPDRGGVGFKLDAAYGETQDMIEDTIRGAAPGSLTEIDRNVQHASIGYTAPLGRVVRIDAGKFVTHIGGETIKSVKNWNYSRSFYFTYAIPFQDVGVHVSYPWTDTLVTDLYVLNGWNVTIDNNEGKTVSGAACWTVTDGVCICAAYMVGPEQNGNDRHQRHLGDAQLCLGPFYG
jgi:hypothetical protein